MKAIAPTLQTQHKQPSDASVYDITFWDAMSETMTHTHIHNKLERGWNIQIRPSGNYSCHTQRSGRNEIIVIHPCS